MIKGNLAIEIIEDTFHTIKASGLAVQEIRELQDEIVKLRCFQKFYLHIRRELNELDVIKNNPNSMHKQVCCKICGKTFEEITGIPEIIDV